MSDKNYTTGTATLIFTGLTLEQAECFAHWYEAQAEQDTTWFEAMDIAAPMADVRGGYMSVNKENQTVTCHLHTPPKK